MKKIAKLLCCGVLALGVAASGCASIGVWSSDAQKQIAEYVGWANQWIGGALKAAPAVLAEATTLFGANNQGVKDANAALTAASGALEALNSAANAGAVTNTQQTNIQAACDAINKTVGAVQQAIAQAKAIPPAAPVTPAPATK
jgi:hypothetical protein